MKPTNSTKYKIALLRMRLVIFNRSCDDIILEISIPRVSSSELLFSHLFSINS